MGDRTRAAFHACVLGLLVGGYFAARLFAQAPVATAVVERSLLDEWLKPDVVIGGALVLLYAGELRGDMKRIKTDVRALQQRLHDDYMTRETIEARLRAKR